MKIKTIEELVAICHEIDGKSVTECNAIAKREGVNGKLLNYLRSVLGYTVPRPPRYPEELKREVLAKVKECEKSVPEIAREYKLSDQLVYDWIYRSGIAYRVHDFWSPIKIKSLVLMITRGYKYKDMASKLGCTTRTAAAMAYNIKYRKTKKWCKVAEDAGLYRFLEGAKNGTNGSKAA